METLTLQGPRYKTHPLSLHQAKSFKALLERKLALGQKIGSQIEIFENKRTSLENPKRFQVFWTPPPAQQKKIARNQQLLRIDRGIEQLPNYELSTANFPEGYAGVKNKKDKKTYVLSISDEDSSKWKCSCEDHVFSCQFAGICCKHITIYKALKMQEGEKTSK